MSKLFFKTLNEKISLTKEEEDIIRSFAISKKIRKKQYLLQAGDCCKALAFVEHGTLRAYSVDDRGQEHIIRFAMEGWTISDFDSFMSNEPSVYNIDALEDTMTGTTLTLEGQTLQITGGVQGDEGLNSYIWIPSIKAVITGDTDYNGVYCYTAETTPAQRVAWATSISKIQALKPEIVVAGHKNPTLKDDASSLEFTKGYLAFYDATLPTAKSSADFQAKIKAKYTLDLPIILQLAADGLKY